jgi:hypothetical protein
MSYFARAAMRLVLDMDDADRAEFNQMLAQLDHALSHSAMLPPGHPSKATRESQVRRNFISEYDL